MKNFSEMNGTGIFEKTLTGELLQSYMSMDADMLEAIENGEVESVDILVDLDKKTAETRVNNELNDAPYVGDDFKCVVEWLVENNPENEHAE